MNYFPDSPFEFYKMQGSGNDFIVLDNRQKIISRSRMSELAVKLCPRKFSVGADGIIFLENSDDPELDFIWHFYNSDGSRAEMCGNGSRCAALFAWHMNMAPRHLVFGTDAGPVRAGIEGRDQVKVQLTIPRDMKLDIVLKLDTQETLTVHSINTGVPHAVVMCRDLKNTDVSSLGRIIRRHEYFAPHGANVNFVQVKDSGRIDLRTYERGVEDETFACGTGAAASVVTGRSLGLLDDSVEVVTSGGERLIIDYSGEDVFLSGQACFIYKGELSRDFIPII